MVPAAPKESQLQRRIILLERFVLFLSVVFTVSFTTDPENILCTSPCIVLVVVHQAFPSRKKCMQTKQHWFKLACFVF